jgi:hypothetical protein
MAPQKRKRRGIGRQYKAGTHGKSNNYSNGRKRKDVGQACNPTDRARKSKDPPASSRSVMKTDKEPTSTTTGTPILAGLNSVSINLKSNFDKSVSKESANTTTLPKLNRQIVDFASIPSEPIDPDAYSRKKDGTVRSNAAARKALSRDVCKITDAIKSIPDRKQQAVALQKALTHPGIREVVKSAGYNPIATEVAQYNNHQMGKVINRLTTNHFLSQ